MLRHFLAAAFALFLAAPAIAAEEAAAPPKAEPPVMGSIVKLKDGKLTMKTMEGTNLTYTVPADVRVSQTKQVTLDDVKEGQFIGTTAVEGPDGKLKAQEIHIFAEEMRGVGEGHYPWGDDPNTTMTNGNIEKLKGVKAGHKLKVSYKGGETEIQVPADIPVVMIEPASADLLKPGAVVNVFAMKNADGSMTAGGIGVVTPAPETATN
jgi:hypothetical protein